MMEITLIQSMQHIFLKLKFYITKGYTHDYKIELNENVLIITINDEKIKGKVVNIEKIMCDEEFIAYCYEIQCLDGIYLVDTSEILCVLK